jgi:two-component system sensor histidine kinase ChvG
VNAVSQIDTRTADPVDKPDIILGEDWDERARADEKMEEPVLEKRRLIALNRSPLARKIITFNLLALVVLVGGILYLNQSREGLVEQRERGLTTEARLMARVFEAKGGADALAPDDVVQSLGLTRGEAVFVFDAEGQPVATSVGTSRPKAGTETDAPQGTFITGLLNTIWDSAARLFGSDTERVLNASDLAVQMMRAGLAGKTLSQNVTDAEGNLLFAVATPLMNGAEVAGALVLTTASGEINDIVRTEREQVLQMFVIAILVSIGLSLVLAGTIANPLRDLAMAAELGKAKNARKMSPGRIRIPDMTARPDEIGRLSGALRDMIAALYDRIEANEQFAADVAHEIKNPLASLRSAVETMRMARTDEQRAKLLNVIEHDARRLDRLVSDISNASRLDSELVKEEMEAFDLIPMLDNIAMFQRQEAEEKGVEFISDLPKAQIILRGLEGRLAQVFVNLLTNAISFCEEGDAVRIWARRRENRVLIVVEDTGPGIPDEAVAKIFNRFYSHRPDDFGNHSGLGLAISKQIVEAHGGVIWAENIRPTEADITSDPLGARFVVGLPV